MPGLVHVGFVVGEVALGQVSLRVLRFSPVNIIPLGLHTHISSGGWWPQFRDIVPLHRHEQQLIAETETYVFFHYIQLMRSWRCGRTF
jgi:hypothetical protein